jgi:hypothetical protein
MLFMRGPMVLKLEGQFRNRKVRIVYSNKFQTIVGNWQTAEKPPIMSLCGKNQKAACFINKIDRRLRKGAGDSV